MILAIDPGTEKSAYVLWNGEIVTDAAIIPNIEMLSVILKYSNAVMVIEMVASYGMAVGQTIFETVFWTGRFYQHGRRMNMDVHRLFRRECKSELCNSAKAKDSNIRQAIIDRLGEIGTKKNPGPLYKIRGAGGKDIWAALAVAITYESKAKLNQLPL